MKISNRGKQWKEFSELVLRHIEDYTVPQYGDYPDDQIEEWDSFDCVRTIKKRCSRFGTNSRENQEQLDLLKIAHESCLAYFKILKETRK